jgi:hypothetical protein
MTPKSRGADHWQLGITDSPRPPNVRSPKADRHTTQQKVIGYATGTSRIASFVVLRDVADHRARPDADQRAGSKIAQS